MNRFVLLTLAALVTAACGQSDEADVTSTPAVESASTTNQAVENAPAAPAAGGSAQNDQAGEPAAAPVRTAEADLSAVAAAGFVEGRHYQVLSPAQPTNTAPGMIEVNEFFMHTCPHCRTLEPYVEAWLEDKPDFINFVRVPTTWSDLNIVHARAYYTAESLGIADEIMMPFFAELHDRGNALESEAKLASFFERFDVSAEDFKSHYNSFSVNTKINNAARDAQRYRIDSTPTIVVNGKYRTGVDRAGGFDQLFELIELLAAAERGE